MKYLIVDASLNGTGIRNCYEGGYIPLEDLGLKSETIKLLNKWLLKYKNEHYKGFEDDCLIDELDKEGKKIALIIRNELSEVKIEYFSDARMVKEII